MKKILSCILVLGCLGIWGCSVPSVARYNELYSFTKEQYKLKGRIGSKAKVTKIRDLRGDQIDEEDLAGLKEEVEKYIGQHGDLSEAAKNNLRGLKVTKGSTAEEVELLLGEPLKISAVNNKAYPASEVWIYRLRRTNAFLFFIIPVFVVHEAYYLYFNGDILTAIEKRYLHQTIYQSDGSPPSETPG